MATPYEQRLQSVDRRAESELGDTILYRVNGGASVEVIGFIRNYGEDEQGYASLQPGHIRWRGKIAKALLATKPTNDDTLSAAILEGEWRPSSDTISQDGRYWVFDMERA